MTGRHTEAYEQLFSWLSKFPHITKHINWWRFPFIMLHAVNNQQTHRRENTLVK